MKYLQNLVANCLQLKYEINYAYLLQFVNMETLLQQTSNKSKLNNVIVLLIFNGKVEMYTNINTGIS